MSLYVDEAKKTSSIYRPHLHSNGNDGQGSTKVQPRVKAVVRKITVYGDDCKSGGSVKIEGLYIDVKQDLRLKKRM